MADPVLYYVEESAEVGRIVAVAPMALREEDRLKNWVQMGITPFEYKMFTDGREVVTDWYVRLDQKTRIHSLVSKKTKGMPAVENLITACRVESMDDPDYWIVEVPTTGIWMRLSDRVSRRGGKATFWAVSSDNPLIVFNRGTVDFAVEGGQFLFATPDEPYQLYTDARTLRIGLCTI